MQMTFAVTTSDNDLVATNNAFSYISLTSRGIAAGAGILGLSTSPKAVSAMNSVYNLGLKSYRLGANSASKRALVDLIAANRSAFNKVGRWTSDKDKVRLDDVRPGRESRHEPGVTAEPPNVDRSAGNSTSEHGHPSDYGLGEGDTSGDEDIGSHEAPEAGDGGFNQEPIEVGPKD